MRSFLIFLLFLFLFGVGSSEPYQSPDPVLARIVDQPRLPGVRVSPDYRWVAFFRQPGHPSIAQLSAPELKLAGIRFRPDRYAPSREIGSDRVTMSDLKSGESWVVQVPEGEISEPSWSPDAKTLAFLLETSDGLRLWAVPAGGKKARRLSEERVNAVLTGRSFRWSRDGESVLTCLVVGGDVAEQHRVPEGPMIQESSGSKAPVRTYQDLLKSEADADQFEHYTTSQLARVGLDGGVEKLGQPDTTGSFSLSPDGRYILQTTIERPYSFIVPAQRFGGSYRVLDRDGKLLETVATFPASEELPKGFDSVRTGRRSVSWRADEPATLVWAEALDGGDMKNEVPYHDRLYSWSAPFEAKPEKFLDLEMRYSKLSWGHDSLALVSEWRFSDRRTRTWKFNPAELDEAKVLFDDRSYNDRYNDPGNPQTVQGPLGTTVLATVEDGNTLLLSGLGASPQGNVPFLDRWSAETGEATRVWSSEPGYYERVVGLMHPQGRQLLTLRESPDEPPNYFLRDLEEGTLTALTQMPHPTPEFKGISKELLTYKRADGVDLSGTLYLPAGYEGGRLPVLMWAYPREYKDASVAGQVTDSPYEFKRVSYWGPLPFLALGYAVFDGPTMPIVGEGNKLPNDEFRSQLVASAEAAVDVLVEKGVCDPQRVAIGGHSYGAFMVANLLAHSDLFKTGIARSGAYNRSLTPFGFQGEERDFWEGQQTYAAMSPFFHAEKINEPILMIHGEEDNNSGTYPLQSERMFSALKGLGGRARLVMLPKESHGYRARESLLHMLWEEQRWLGTHLGNAGP